MIEQGLHFSSQRHFTSHSLHLTISISEEEAENAGNRREPENHFSVINSPQCVRAPANRERHYQHIELISPETGNGQQLFLLNFQLDAC